MTIVEHFKLNYGKSHRDYVGRYPGPFRLHDHVIDAVHILAHLLKYLMPDYDKTKADILVFGTYLHDIGKLDANFQEMLRRVHTGESLSGLPRVKHEASTFEHVDKVTPNDIDAICAMLRDEIGYEANPQLFTNNNVMADIWAFAATHHGLFYVSYEDWGAGIQPCIRRTWTTFYPREQSRLTFTDLLFRYHPLGGVVTACDLLASACQNQGKSVRGLLQEIKSLDNFIECVTAHLDEGERAIQRDNGKDYALGNMLRLILGGIRK